MMPRLHLIFLAAAATAASAAAQTPFSAKRVVSHDADGVWMIHAADLDGDGDLDVLGALTADSAIAWFENDGGRPSAWVRRVITASAALAESVHSADVDGDGDVDVLSASPNDSKVAWYENDGAVPPGWSAHVISTSVSRATCVYADDVDRDGDQDVLSAAWGSGSVYWHENDGARPPAWTTRLVASGAPSVRCVRSSDLDRDGDVDLLSASVADDTVAWYENDGAVPPGWTKHAITTSNDGAEWLNVADVDGDGDPDVFTASLWDQSLRWFENDGQQPPAWTAHLIDDALGYAVQVDSGDLDGDGDVDAVLAHGDRVSWFENDGQRPPGWTQRVLSVSVPRTHGVEVGDLERDGDLDVLGGSQDEDSIPCWPNLHGLPFVDNLVPGTAGLVNVVRVTGATPSSRVGILWDRDEEGRSFLPGLPGVRVDLAGPRIFVLGTSDAAGTFTASAAIPSAFAGSTMYVQAVEESGRVSGLLVQPL